MTIDPGTTLKAARRQGCVCRSTACGASFAALAATDASTRAGLRNRLVESHLHLAHSIATRYAQSGVPFDDIAQVAAVAVVEAVDRFEPDRGVPFSSFAVPTVSGAVKRHFRDHRWVVRTPRRVKERYLEIRAARELLTQRLRRMPTVADLAAHLGYDETEVLNALQAVGGRRPVSLDAPLARIAGSEETLGSRLGSCDDSYEWVEYRESLRPLLVALPGREARVVTMRFFENMTQTQIAVDLGCSQMHVSRLLRRALARLRHGLLDGPPAPAMAPGERRAAA
jgi:RNA polymerase sigma-B factor